MEDNNQPSSSEAGLLDGATATEDTQSQNPVATNVDHKAASPEEDDSPLERPDWWPENFWKKDESEPDLEAIAKSWGDLRKQISQGKHKPPADGKYDTSAFGSIPEDDPVRTTVMGWANEFGISQLALDKLVGQVVEMGGVQQQQVAFNREAEIKALGPNANAMIKSMTDWGRSLVNKGIWGADDFEEFKIMGGTAKGIKALSKLRETYEGTKIPLNSVPVDGAPSKDDLYAMVNDPKYKTDTAYRQKVERMFQQTFG